MLKIGELSNKTGCQVVTIRYYEKKGLLNKPERTNNNYRLYSASDLERLEFILHCRKHDISLDEIKNLLAYRDNPTRNCKWVGDMLDVHILRVSEQIKSLKKLKNDLQNLRCKCSDETDENQCEIVKSLRQYRQ